MDSLRRTPTRLGIHRPSDGQTRDASSYHAPDEPTNKLRKRILTERGLKDLQLLKPKYSINYSEDKPTSTRTRFESPWNEYTERFILNLHESFHVCTRTLAPKEMIVMRRFSGSRGERMMENLKRIHHRNIIALFEDFYFEGYFYAISENFSYSLLFFNRAKMDLQDFELAIIFKQVHSLKFYKSNKLNDIDL